MPKWYKRKAVDPNGNPLKPVTLYGFFALLTHKQTGEKLQGGEVVVPGYVLGEANEANAAVELHKKNLEENYQDYTVNVQKEALEKVGPIMQEQMIGVREMAQFEHMVGFYLAAQLVQERAKISLEINPLADEGAKIQAVIQEAREVCAKRIQDAQKADAMRAAQAATGLVDAQGNPVASGQPVSDQTQDSSAQTEDESALDAEYSVTEAEPKGKLIAFPTPPAAEAPAVNAQA